MNSDRSLTLIRALLSSLAHKIRTPLSVIQNDLTYFKTLLPSDEVERGLDKCLEVNDLLKSISLDSLDNRTEELDLGALCGKVLEERGWLIADEAQPITAVVNGSVLKLLLQFIDTYYSEGKRSGPSKFWVSKTTGGKCAQISLKISLKAVISGRYASLGEYVSGQNSVESPLVPLIDALALALPCNLMISVGSEVSILITL